MRLNFCTKILPIEKNRVFIVNFLEKLKSEFFIHLTVNISKKKFSI